MGGADQMNPREPLPDPPAPVPSAPVPSAGWAGRLGRLGRGRLLVIGGVVLAAAVALSVVSATIGSGQPATGSGQPAGGSLGQAKNFTLSVLGHPGRHLSLSSFAGRPVIVNFFASWCHPCQQETPLIARFYRARHGKLTIIGIDVNDSAVAAQAFTRKSGVRYPVVVDPAPMKTAIAYQLPGLPATFFLNARHQIVKRVFGPVTMTTLSSGSKLMTGQGR